jgi:hypothetical protein
MAVRTRKTLKRRCFFFLFLVIPALFLFSQNGDAVQPQGFRGVSLGMDLDTVKGLLLEDPYFDYRGDPDVSFLPRSVESLIECRGNSYVDRAYFQFAEKKLYIMTIVLDLDRIDHYSVFTRLTDKYGPFTSLTPLKVTWEFSDTVLTLERPLALKYIDKEVFDRQLEEGQAKEAVQDISRKRFLENF